MYKLVTKVTLVVNFFFSFPTFNTNASHFTGEFDLQGGLRCWLPLYPAFHLQRLRHAPPDQVRAATLSQPSGLLHIPAHGEKDLHALHGGHLCCLHLNVHQRNGLPHLQTYQKDDQKEEGVQHAEVHGKSRNGPSLTSKVVQIQILSKSGSYGIYSESQQHQD